MGCFLQLWVSFGARRAGRVQFLRVVAEVPTAWVVASWAALRSCRTSAVLRSVTLSQHVNLTLTCLGFTITL